MKKLSIILAVVLLLAALTLPVMAADPGSASLTSASAHAGGKVKLTLSLSGVGEVTDLGVTVSWDAEGLTYLHNESAWLKEGSFAPISPNGDAGWCVEGEAVDVNGDVLTLVFSVPQGTPEGEYTVSCTVIGKTRDSQTGEPKVEFVYETNPAKVTVGHSGGTATCVDKAVCAICSEPYGELLGHTYDRQVEKKTFVKDEATCTDGAVYYYSCVCGKAGTETFTGKPLGHTGGSATCKEQAVCTRCGQSYGEYGSHSYAWLPSQEGCVQKCIVCTAELEPVEHQDANGDITCDRCQQDMKFKLHGANLKLGDSLTMYFYIPVDKLEGDGYYAEVVRYYTDDPAGRYEDDPNAPKSESYTVQFADWEEYSDTLMRVPYEGLAAKEMIDEIHVTVYNSEGKAVSHTWVDSVEKYCLRMAGNTAQHSTVRAMCVALLNYGAEAQKFFTYSQAEATLANRGAAAYQSLIPQVDMPENRQVKCDGYVGSSLDLESEVVMTVYFSNMSRDMHATFSYTDHYGDTYSQRVEGSEFFERSASGNIYGVKVRGMSMGDYDQVVTVNVYKADGTHVYTIKDSMGSYLRRMCDKNSDDSLYRETATAMAMAHACLHRNDK